MLDVDDLTRTELASLAPSLRASSGHPQAPLHLLDTTMLFAPKSGGVKRYLMAKRTWLARTRPDLRHTLVTPGARLTDAKKRHKALVRADGALSFGEKVGSIHRIGAIAQGLDACNGWTFWHIETPKGLMPIDAFRAQVREEMSEAAE